MEVRCIAWRGCGNPDCMHYFNHKPILLGGYRDCREHQVCQLLCKTTICEDVNEVSLLEEALLETQAV